VLIWALSYFCKYLVEFTARIDEQLAKSFYINICSVQSMNEVNCDHELASVMFYRKDAKGPYIEEGYFCCKCSGEFPNGGKIIRMRE